MDSPQTTTHIGLCAGYGGIELGLKRAVPDLRTVALCEVEAFAIANLVAKMEAGQLDPAPIWTDLKTFPYKSFHGRVDILTGGYPCQPFSAAGQRKGKQDPRHLWPFIADGIRLLKPKCCFFENVEGHISLGLSDVIEDLAGMGYRTTWGIFSASECGAPHRRKRVFILAYASSWRGKGLHDWLTEPADAFTCGNRWPSRPGEQQYAWEPPRVVGNSEDRSNRQHSTEQQGRSAFSRPSGEESVADSHRFDRSAQAEGREHDRQVGPAGEELGDAGCKRQEEQQLPSDWSEQSDSRQTKPPLGGDADGSASGLDYAELCVSGDNRTDELRLLGNGVVPATAALAFRTLAREILR